MSLEFEQIIRESIQEEIALIKEGLKTYYHWSEDRGRTYGVYPKSYGNPKPILKGKEKDLMKVLLKISKHNKSYLEDAFFETQDPDTMDELNLDTSKMAKLGIGESVNEISTKAGLEDVIKGRTTSIEGIKFSKELADALLYWIQTSPYGRKYGKHIMKGRIASLIGPANVMGFANRLKGKQKAEWKAIINKFNTKKEVTEAKTYKDYGISGKMDMALAKLPDALFNKKGITKLAKKLGQDPKKAIAYAKDAFDWLYKEGIGESVIGIKTDGNAQVKHIDGVKKALDKAKIKYKFNRLSMTLSVIDIDKKDFAKAKAIVDASKLTIMLAKEGISEAFRPGDMWSKNFDYKGMMKAAMKINSSTDVEIVQKLADSMEDVNYHTEASYLFDIIPALKQLQKNSKITPAMQGKIAAKVDDVLRKFNKVAKATYASMR